MYCSFHKNINQHNYFQLATDNNKKCFWAANQHTGMISKGSCDTEDWSNDAENSALHHKNKLHYKVIIIENSSFKLHCFTILLFLLYFDQINAALVNNQLKNVY